MAHANKVQLSFFLLLEALYYRAKDIHFIIQVFQAGVGAANQDTAFIIILKP